jgi:hypothetical protein
MQGLLCLDLRGLAQEQSGERSGKDGQLYLAGLESPEQLGQRRQPSRHYFPEKLPPIMRELVSKVRLRPAMASNGCYILAVARIGFLNLIWETFWASQNSMGNH